MARITGSHGIRIKIRIHIYSYIYRCPDNLERHNGTLSGLPLPAELNDAESYRVRGKWLADWKGSDEARCWFVGMGVANGNGSERWLLGLCDVTNEFNHAEINELVLVATETSNVRNESCVVGWTRHTHGCDTSPRVFKQCLCLSSHWTLLFVACSRSLCSDQGRTQRLTDHGNARRG